MRVIDLLALMADLNQNTTIWMHSAEQPLRVTGVAPTDPDAPDQLVLTTAAAPAHALKRWELIMLTQAPALRRCTVYAQVDDQLVPIFGFAFQDGAIVLY